MLLKEYGDVEVDKVTISKLIGGMRGLKCLVTISLNVKEINGLNQGKRLFQKYSG